MQFSSTLGRNYASSQLSFASSQASRITDMKLRAALKNTVASMKPESEEFSAEGRNYAIVVRRDG